MHAIGSTATGILALLLGLIVAWKGKRPSEKWSFAWFSFTTAGWFICYGFMESTLLIQKALFFARFGHSFVVLVPIAYLQFVSHFLHRPSLRSYYVGYYFIGLILLTLMWTTSNFVPGVKQHPWGFYPMGSPIMLFDATLVVITAVSCWILFLVDCRKARKDPIHEGYNKLRWCCFAMTVFSFSAVDYFPKFDVNIYPFGFLTTSFFISIMAYAILFHRLMDITIVFRKSLVYSILAALITAFYLVAVLIMEKWFQGFFGYLSLVATAITGFIIAMSFVPMRNWVQTLVDRYFFKGSQLELARENEQLRRQIERTERLKAVATLAAGMAHEIKNPLASIKTFSEYLPEKYEDPAFRDKFSKVMRQEVDRMNELVHRLLEFAKPSPPELALVDVSQTLKETLDFIHGSLLKKQIQVETHFAERDEVKADETQLKQVFLNVLLNSIEAMDQPGHIKISTTRENNHLEISIADTGPGVAPKDLQRVFDPFFTTKPAGTGLGLSVVHSIIRQHGGRINIHSHVGEGTTVRIDLPVNGGANGKDAHLNS